MHYEITLYRLYSKVKGCEMSVVKKYCQQEMTQLVDPYNPFCKKDVKSNQASQQVPGTYITLLILVYMIKLV